ncbi:MAG: hypothetical protein HXS44_01435 [Theionarchaea archaeon]|nr:hypothetical protein [Theionarchaea archaeon]
MNMTRKEIRELAEKVAELTRSGKSETALQALKPVLDYKCPFAKLDTLGQHICETGENPKEFFETFDRIVNYNAMGGFVIVDRP